MRSRGVVPITKRPVCQTCGRSFAKAGNVSDAAMYRVLVENAGDLIVRGDAGLNRTFISPSVQDLLGFDPATMLGKHAYELVHPEDLGKVRAVLEQIGPEHPILQITFRMRRQDGGYVWMDGRYRYIPDDGGLIAILRDITAQHEAEERLAESNAQLEAANQILKNLADHDGLTGLANRRRFDEQLETEFRRARRLVLPLGLVLLDIDCFKAYNDLYGHLAGDDCLRRVANAIEGALYRPGEEAARYGGEEIVALLPGTDIHAATLVAERMRQAVAALEIVHSGSPSGITTVSAGVSSFTPLTEDNASHLVAAADRALYRAKSAGRNCVVTAGGDPSSPARQAMAGP